LIKYIHRNTDPACRCPDCVKRRATGPVFLDARPGGDGHLRDARGKIVMRKEEMDAEIARRRRKGRPDD
jgi:hypothetical protein